MQLKNIRYQLLLILLCFACAESRDKSTPHRAKVPVVDLQEIRSQGRLIAITDFNSTNYFIYRGQPMGYQYELIQELADHLGIKLDVRVSNDLEESFNCLIAGECNLIAINLTVTKERKKLFDFTEPHSQTRQVLIQRKPENWKELSQSELERSLIMNPLDLAGKTIYVKQNSAFSARLKNLSDEIGDTIDIREVPDDPEQLIMLVAQGDIDYSVTDENVALVNQTYYPNIDVSMAISFPQNLAWAVQKGAVNLRREIDLWLVEFKQTARYAVIYNKYFKNQKSAEIVRSDYFTISSGKISPYDQAIRKYSEQIGLDWRLVASMIYQESGFNPQARSWAGAYGLMQLMPTTARRFGVSRNSSPDQQIRAGIEFIKWLDNRFKDQVPREDERIKFILAAYNVGYGHVVDAMNLAEKNGKNPKVWDQNVDEFLLKKSNPKYYLDPVVKYGYCRGNEPYQYVTEVLERYEHYKNIIKEDHRSVLGFQQIPK
ncbi:MAG: lytic transglycosylase [Bacteroides sp. SM23_62_1]|nr:MAG: lytic transglycosylase [Bacteroides sp. SM23_62_1]